MKDIRSVYILEGDAVAASLLDGTLFLGEAIEVFEDAVLVKQGQTRIKVSKERALVVPRFYKDSLPLS